MAEPERDSNSNGESGSKDRATVALVDAKVDGLKELIRAEFANVKDSVRALAAVVSQVIKLEVQGDDHERRISNIEDTLEGRRAREHDWKRDRLPALIIGGIGLVVGAVGLITQIH